MKITKIFEKNVRVNDDQMVSLTDLWKAAGRPKNKKIHDFVNKKDTKEYIDYLSSKTGIPALNIIKGGKFPGTWSHKYIAYDYASWVSPEFKFGVHTILDEFFKGNLKPVVQQELQKHTLKIKSSEERGKFHGKGLAKRRKEKRELSEESIKLIKKYQLQLGFFE